MYKRSRKSNTFSFGKWPVTSKRKVNEVELEVEIREEPNGEKVFSASGGIWDAHHTDYVMCGQCLDSILEEIPELKKNDLYMEIYGLWHRCHLNNMRAGSPKQENAIEKWLNSGNQYDYETACEFLRSIGLYEDKEYIKDGKPYRYGTAWLYEEIPDEDMSKIERLLNCED